ncbi:MAG: hypothetical protein WKG07_50295 [Hymenobacter sp.]
MRVLTGSSLSQTIATNAQQASGILESKFPEVEAGGGQDAARPKSPPTPMPVEAGDLMVILKDQQPSGLRPAPARSWPTRWQAALAVHSGRQLRAFSSPSRCASTS